ncbi:hypothetical protein DFR60_104239 [Hungatella effluvii]|uniref:Uncharacterized protein n=1 Tax=Hungatella effluvii TaxID=1096246 RepID=A0A2V3Y8A3_9FIRM|nr:hypothetical protein [Hungatella effluvii]PXX54413.1 hypothetical protein DFR60_104239 [Hungatella effluvii]
MYNEIVDKVAEELSILFPPEQGYYIYTEAANQDLLSPCFYTGFLETSEKNTTVAGYYRSSSLSIRYYPGENEQPSREIYRVLDILMNQKWTITLDHGFQLNGTGKNGRIEEGNGSRFLSFFVQFNTFGIREKSMEEAMEGIEIR